jgi:hypothetical protein
MIPGLPTHSKIANVWGTQLSSRSTEPQILRLGLKPSLKDDNGGGCYAYRGPSTPAAKTGPPPLRMTNQNKYGGCRAHSCRVLRSSLLLE